MRRARIVQHPLRGNAFVHSISFQSPFTKGRKGGKQPTQQPKREGVLLCAKNVRIRQGPQLPQLAREKHGTAIVESRHPRSGAHALEDSARRRREAESEVSPGMDEESERRERVEERGQRGVSV